jgi:hypothetical protein
MIEQVGLPCQWTRMRGGHAVLAPVVPNREASARLLACPSGVEQLPDIVGVYTAAPLCLVDGKLVQAGTGYDTVTRTYATGHGADEVPYDEAVALLQGLFADFTFVTEADRARAMCALLTPALKFGGLLPREAPIFVVEADDSQAGKGYMTKLIAAVYGETFADITQRNGGVGSLDETIDAALLSGKAMIRLDNLRGRLDSPRLESIVTALAPIPCRAPYAGSVMVDPSRVVLLATSNGMEGTRDLANRCCIVRIRKRHGAAAEFRKFDEGDLLDHVSANRGKYLGAVYAVLRRWDELGRKSSAESRHDMRQWVKMLDGIVQYVMGMPAPMDGHESAKNRAASPALGWIRQMCSELETAGLLHTAVKPLQLAEMAVDNPDRCAVPGVKMMGDTLGCAKVVGALLASAYRTADEEDILLVDEYTVYRWGVASYDKFGHSRKAYSYVFSKGGAFTKEQAYELCEEAHGASVRNPIHAGMLSPFPNGPQAQYKPALPPQPGSLPPFVYPATKASA